MTALLAPVISLRHRQAANSPRMGMRDSPMFDSAHVPRLSRDAGADPSISTAPPPSSSTSTSTSTSTSSSLLSHLLPTRKDSDSSSSSSGNSSDDGSHTVDVATEWAKRKAQFVAHFKSFSDNNDKHSTDPQPLEHSTSAPASINESHAKCHVCNAALRLLRLRHHCRNCGLAVCGVHSKNQVPLPHIGIMKEVRVCDICTRQLVQRRAGYRSPRTEKRSGSIDHDDRDAGTLSSASVDAKPSRPLSPPLPPPPLRCFGSSTATTTMTTTTPAVIQPPPPPTDVASAQLFGHMDGIIYSCALEEQDNTVDDLLYLGTFTMGGRSFVSRRMSANVAIWKDRTFMLTSAEMLCFKATEDSTTALGEVRSSVHLTEILHVEVSDQFPRILTAIRSDGRIFRIRAKTPQQCSEIAAALKLAIRRFQDAMYKLQRGPQLEDNWISCVTLQHESSLPEVVVAAAPRLGDAFVVELYPSSILRVYVNGPSVHGVALYSREMLASCATRDHTVEADPLASAAAASTLPNDWSALFVTLQAHDALSTTQRHVQQQQLYALVALFVALATAMRSIHVLAIEVLAWLGALMLVLAQWHTPIRLFATTRRIHVARRLRVTCTRVVLGKSSSSNSSSNSNSNSDAAGSTTNNSERSGTSNGVWPSDPLQLADDDLDARFLEGCNGDVDDAKRRFVQTMQWRDANAIDDLFFRRSPHFETMKASFVHYTHKTDKLGHPVSIEYLGAMKKSMEYFVARGVSEDDAVLHHILLQEFLWRVVDPRPYPEGVMLKIYDIKGISMSDVSGDVFNYMKRLGEIVAEYNPERIYQVFIVHPPSWFNFIWKVVSPLINPKTRERVHVLRGDKEIQKALLEFVDAANLPVAFGGTCRCGKGESDGGCATHAPEETDLRDYMAFVNSYEGEPGDAVVRARFEALCAKYRARLPTGSDSVGQMDASAKSGRWSESTVTEI